MSLSFPRISRHSLVVKITVVMAFSIGLVSLATSLLDMHTTHKSGQSLVAQRALAETGLVSSVIAGPTKFGKPDIIRVVLESAMAQSSGQNINSLVIGADGEPIVQAGDQHDKAAEDIGIAREALKAGTTIQADGGFLIGVPIRYGEDQAIVGAIAARWDAEILSRELWASQVRDLWIATVAFILTTLTAMALFGRMILTPLTRLRDAIRGLEHRDYSEGIPGQTRRDEIGQISNSLEDLRRTLAATEATERDALLKSAAFMGTSASLMLLDTDLVIRSVNPSAVKLFGGHHTFVGSRHAGFDPEKMAGTSIDRFHVKAADVRARIAQAGRSGFDTTLTFGESRIQLTVGQINDAEGNLAGFVAEWKDVTRDWFNAAMIEAIEQGQTKAEFDRTGQLIQANALFCRSLGGSLESLRGVKLQDLVQPFDESPETGASLFATLSVEANHVGRLRLCRPNGTPALIDGSISTVRDHEGKAIRFLLIGRDVTVQDAELRVARTERQDAERQQGRVVEALRIGLRKLAAGDLSSAIAEPFAGSYEELRADYNNTVHNLANAMREIADNAENIRNEARDISTTADGLSRRTENTAATLEQTAAALDELTTGVKASAEGAMRADKAVITAKANAEDSGKVVLETVAAMGQISESSDRINSIIKVIDDIAFQTNLLALNAGVEAARAGDAGRGFAVVASEVRALAQRSSDAAREINGLIAQSALQVRRGVDLVGETGRALNQIVDSVSEISELVSEIAASSQQQSANLADINMSVNQLDQSTQQNAARLEETTAASEALRNDAVALVGTVSHFVLPETGQPESSVLSFRSRQRDDAAAEPVPGRRAARGHAAPAASEETWQDF